MYHQVEVDSVPIITQWLDSKMGLTQWQVVKPTSEERTKLKKNKLQTGMQRISHQQLTLQLHIQKGSTTR